MRVVPIVKTVEEVLMRRHYEEQGDEASPGRLIPVHQFAALRSP
jgi:hypothetical protein